MQQTSRSKLHQEPRIPVPHVAFPCCRHAHSRQSAPEAPWQIILIGVNLFSLQTAEPALNHDIICPAALPIHTLPNLKAFQQSLVLYTDKLTPLIGVQDKAGSGYCSNRRSVRPTYPCVRNANAA